jgi:hypothetical protein
MGLDYKGFSGSVNNSDTFLIPRFSKRRSFRALLCILVATVLTIAYVHGRRAAYNVEESILRYLSLTSEEQLRLHNHRLAALEAGLRQCASFKHRPVSIADESRMNPRAVPNSRPVLIRNANLIDGDGSQKSGISILLFAGVIKEIGDNIEAPENAKVIDVGGRYVSPGLVDMVLFQSHASLSLAFSCRRQFSSGTFRRE